MVVIAARGHKASARHVPHYVEADEVVIEAKRVVYVGDVQVDVAHLGA